MIRTGLIGREIGASRSPWLHEQEARAQGIELSYELFDFAARGLDEDDLGPFLRDLSERGYSGVNVTFPYKQAVIPLLNTLDASAEAVGAVNTITMKDGALTGHNTDMMGFRSSIEQGLPGRPLGRVLQLGAGGAGAAIASALLSLGSGEVVIVDRDWERAESLARSMAARFGEGRVVAQPFPVASADGFDGIVNTTPVGMEKSPGTPIDPALLSPDQWVSDIVYFPRETELLKRAAAIGCPTLDGSGMVIAQAAAAFALFTNATADRERMRRGF